MEHKINNNGLMQYKINNTHFGITMDSLFGKY